MELNEEILSKKTSVSVAQRVKHYRQQRKNEAIYKQNTAKTVENLKDLKTDRISQTQRSKYRAAARERKRRSRAMRKAARHDISRKKGDKSTYRTHYVKKTVKNTYKTLPRSPDEQAEVLAKLAEQALSKLQSLGPSPKRNLFRAKIKMEKFQ